MEALHKLAHYIQGLDQQQFRRFQLMALGIVLFVTTCIVYSIQQKKTELINNIIQLHALSKKAVAIIQDNKIMTGDELRYREILEKNRDFTIKSFFEQFCKEQDLVAEVGWDTRTEVINEQFDEIILPATFKNQTTEKITKVLMALDQKEIVYIKDLKISNESTGKVSFELTIATKKYKALID